MEDFVRKGNLYELYGGLLKENPRRVYEYYVVDDMSFSEIGEELSISRQAAQELFRRADRKLQSFEEILRLQEKLLRIRGLALSIREQCRDPKIEALAREIIDGI